MNKTIKLRSEKEIKIDWPDFSGMVDQDGKVIDEKKRELISFSRNLLPKLSGSLGGDTEMLAEALKDVLQEASLNGANFNVLEIMGEEFAGYIRQGREIEFRQQAFASNSLWKEFFKGAWEKTNQFTWTHGGQISLDYAEDDFENFLVDAIANSGIQATILQLIRNQEIPEDQVEEARTFYSNLFSEKAILGLKNNPKLEVSQDVQDFLRGVFATHVKNVKFVSKRVEIEKLRAENMAWWEKEGVYMGSLKKIGQLAANLVSGKWIQKARAFKEAAGKDIEDIRERLRTSPSFRKQFIASTSRLSIIGIGTALGIKSLLDDEDDGFHGSNVAVSGVGRGAIVLGDLDDDGRSDDSQDADLDLADLGDDLAEDPILSAANSYFTVSNPPENEHAEKEIGHPEDYNWEETLQSPGWLNEAGAEGEEGLGHVTPDSIANYLQERFSLSEDHPEIEEKDRTFNILTQDFGTERGLDADLGEDGNAFGEDGSGLGFKPGEDIPIVDVDDLDDDQRDETAAETFFAVDQEGIHKAMVTGEMKDVFEIVTKTVDEIPGLSQAEKDALVDQIVYQDFGIVAKDQAAFERGESDFSTGTTFLSDPDAKGVQHEQVRLTNFLLDLEKSGDNLEQENAQNIDANNGGAFAISWRFNEDGKLEVRAEMFVGSTVADSAEEKSSGQNSPLQLDLNRLIKYQATTKSEDGEGGTNDDSSISPPPGTTITPTPPVIPPPVIPPPVIPPPVIPPVEDEGNANNGWGNFGEGGGTSENNDGSEGDNVNNGDKEGKTPPKGIIKKEEKEAGEGG